MSDTYGWDLLVTTSVRDGQPLSQLDVIKLVVHWTLSRHGWRCQGLEDDNANFDGNAAGTEWLPAGWQNLSEESGIRYTADGKRYILIVSCVDGDVIFNMLRVFDHDVRCVRFHLADTVRATSGSLPQMVPGYKCVVKSVETTLIATPGKPSGTSTQTQEPRRGSAPNHTSPEPGRTPGLRGPLGPPTPLAVGRADLDPLAGMGPMPHGFGGGGNLFDPFAHGPPGHPELPPGVAPPGARFDPIGPSLPNRPRTGPGSGPAGRYIGEPDYDDLGPPM